MKRQRLTWAAMLVPAAGICSMRAPDVEQQVLRWTRFEASFTSTRTRKHPVSELTFSVAFTSPSGAVHTINGFWDGQQIWKVRFSPDEEGAWTYKTHASDADDDGLDGQSGVFKCIAYKGKNAIYRYGALRLSADRRFLTYADGTPFFWLGDTAWNGPLKADETSWKTYLDDREKKGFTAIQFVTTQWIAAGANADLRVAYEDFERISIDPAFFQWLDARIDAINERGLIAAPVLLWDTGPFGLSPGVTLSDEQMIALARYIVARYDAHQVIWILNGDGDYRGERAGRWKKIGRAVFGEHPNRLVTCHPSGRQWIADEFRNEPWFAFNSYQSSHGADADTFRWITHGPPAQDWTKEPVLASINLEPNYEAHHAFGTSGVFDAHAVRRAAYWSLLAAPPAGISYGAHGIWSWETRPQRPMNHPNTGVASPWFEALHLPGSTQMLYLKRLFDALPWWDLRPDPRLVDVQPGDGDAAAFISSARAKDGSWALLYVPVGGTIELKREELPKATSFRFYNPRDGHWVEAKPLDATQRAVTTPDGEDWVLWIGTRLPSIVVP